ncbi:MAG: clostripain-related cysteine peptidase [Candidatus Eisenbacteria bacterium]
MPKTARTLKPKKRCWTVLAYIAADNNLSDAGLVDVRELCAVGTSKDVYAGVEIDTYGEYTGSIRYEITEPDWTGEAHRTVIQRLKEKDTGDPRTLQSFVKWGLRRYPADNYLFVIWNHGAGFRSIRRDIGYDDFGSSLDMPEIEIAFRKAGINSDNKIAILGFDACLMNMIEIAHHFQDQVDILVGSQQTEPGDGWPYDKVLEAVNKSPTRINMAKEIVDVYIEDYLKMGMVDVTQSAVKISTTETAISALSDLGYLLAARTVEYRTELKRIRLELQTFEMADYVDLIHLAGRLGKHIHDNRIKAASEAVAETTRACILTSRKTGQSVRNANGLSVWFPAVGRLYYDYRGKYVALRFARHNKGWIRFLDAYHS